MLSQSIPAISTEVMRAVDTAHIPERLEIEDILNKSISSPLSLNDLALLSELGKSQQTEERIKRLQEEVFSRFRTGNNTLRHIAPLYLSNYCQDTCGYCGYSAHRKKVQRTRLELSELDEEVDAIIVDGSKVIELVLGSDPSFSPRVLAEYIKKTKRLLEEHDGGGVLLCSDYFSKEEYATLKDAGLWGIVQWDETLNQKKYAKWHRNSPRKSNFEQRINTHDIALSCGLEVATGCLFGLADYRYDTLMQVAKARYLKQEYGKSPFVFGVPRLKSFSDAQIHTPDEITDKQFELALLVYKLAEPHVGRWLQTREKPELNLRNYLDLDVCTYRCGNVVPGGYSVNRNCGGIQFKVNELSRTEFNESLQEINFLVDYNWIRRT